MSLALPVVVHTHYEGVGIAGPVTAAGYPDFDIEYHTLCGERHVRGFVSILCHGIFERFPNTKVMMVEGGLVPFVGLLVAPGHQLEGLPERDPVVLQAPVGVRVGSRQIPRASRSRRPPTPRCWRRPSRVCARGTRSASRATTRTGTTTSPRRRCAPCRRSGARTSPGATRRRSTDCLSRRWW